MVNTINADTKADACYIGKELKIICANSLHCMSASSTLGH